MSGDRTIEIKFNADQLKILWSVLLESYGGYAGYYLPEFLATTDEVLKGLHAAVGEVPISEDAAVTLRESEWRLIYNAVGAVVYELDAELEIIHSHDEGDFVAVGRLIYKALAEPFIAIAREKHSPPPK